MVRRCVGLVLLVAALASTPAAAQRKVYWVGVKTVYRADLDGTNIESLVTDLSGLIDIELDIAGGKMYWSDAGADKIQRANLDGSGVEDVVATGLNRPLGVAIDTVNRKLYWCNWLAERLERADLDGGNVELVISSPGLLDLALDADKGHIYWIGWMSGLGERILRSNLDGSDVVPLIGPADIDFHFSAIALDT